MTYVRWVSMTENETKYRRHQRSVAALMPSWLKPKKQTTIEEVDQTFYDYELGRTRTSFKNIEDTFDDWTDSDAFKQMSRDTIRLQTVKPALDEMMAWREREELAWTRFDHRDVLDKLALAAQCLISKFPMMPDLYKNALQATFLNNAHFSSEELYCIKWYPDLAEWKARVGALGDTSSAAQSATAFTVTWAPTDRLCVTEHKSWTEPFNRGMGLPLGLRQTVKTLFTVR
jgi:hypothetical protein